MKMPLYKHTSSHTSFFSSPLLSNDALPLLISSRCRTTKLLHTSKITCDRPCFPLISTKKDGHEQPSDDGTLNRATNAEAQATSISSEKQVGTIDANNLQHQQLHDELEDQLFDFGDDVTPVTSQNGAILRRKLRMVIDPEDDE